MEIDNALLANELGHTYQALARMIGNYLTSNIESLEKEEISLLGDDQSRITSYANTFYSLSDKIAFSGSDKYFAGLKNATTQINDAISHVNTVNKIVNISAGAITLAAAIAGQNGPGIAAAVASIIAAAA